MADGSTDWRAAERTHTDEVIGTDTIPRLFERSATRNADRPAQQYKGGIYERSLAGSIVRAADPGEYMTLTYEEFQTVVRSLAAGFRDLGVEAGDRVGIFSSTRMEWAQADFALLAAGAVVTTVFKESSPRQVEYLLSDSGATGVIVENREFLDRVLEIEDQLDLDFIVVMDEVSTDRENVFTLAEVYNRGEREFDRAAYEGWLSARSPDDLASLIYTSGTTGKPKGVRLTHRNFRENINQLRKRFGDRPDKSADLPSVGRNTVALSFLPLAHVFERLAGHFFLFASGATVAYAESADTVAEDIQTTQPTAAISVPRVYERIFDSMRENADSALKRRIFERAVDAAKRSSQTENPGHTLRFEHALADRLVYRTVKEAMGDNIEFFISGGGSLSPELSRLFDGMGLPIFEGYGLTEAAPVVSVNPPENPKPGTLGPALTGVETRLDASVLPADRRERAAGEIGELLVRGPNVSAGYWNLPDETDEAFTDVPASEANGESEEQRSSGRWLRTGDIIEYDEDDYLIYHERLKQLLVLTTGKNVAPGPIEDAFATSERVEQAMVLGDDEKFVSALLVPNFEGLRAWAARKNIELPAERAAVCRDENARAWVEEHIEEVNEEVESHEKIKRFELVPVEWTPENDLLTPSLKKKRRNIVEGFDEQVERIYAAGRSVADDD
ncbi:MAG TPA: long-chain fatty acid--CoA ligase [Halococcus sp.]|nr:long-chain fatty acid--CoA ligase [Halococcus sp.]